MKQFLTVLLSVCLILGVSTGCGKNSSTEDISSEQDTVIKIYPDQIDDFVDISNLEEPPEIVYTTPASENGLEGTMYKIIGEVTESVSEEEKAEGFGTFTIKTDIGEVAVIDLRMALLESGGYEEGLTDEEIQPYFPIPEVEERVCVYAEYGGFSNVLKKAAFYYGGEEYVDNIVASLLIDNYKNSTGESETKTQQQIALTEQEKIEDAARKICLENYTSTTISSVSVNENLGTDEDSDYILLVYLTWDVKNSAKTTKKMLAMYSEDFAARVGADIKNVSEFTVFWKVPYHSETENIVKYTYTRKTDGMYQTDAMVSTILN